MRPAPPARALVAALVAFTTWWAAVGVIWWALGELGLSRPPLWAHLLIWGMVAVVRADPVQRALGGGRLDNRFVLRLLIGNAVFALLTASIGLSFVFPLCATLVSSVHLQWSGTRQWPMTVVIASAGTAILELAVHLDLIAHAVPLDVSPVLAFVVLILSSAISVNLAVLTKQRERSSQALAEEQRRTEARLLHAATHDPLTGLTNRSGLAEHLARIGRSAEPCGVLFIDLNGFKAVNDRHGHVIGDELLAAVADRLRNAVRPQDVLARTGGDEFVVLLPGDTDPQAVERAAARVLDRVQGPVALGPGPVLVSASVGRAWAEQVGAAGDELLHAADLDMYVRKRAARPPSGLPVSPLVKG